MSKIPTIATDNEELFAVEKEIKDFCDSHGKNLSEDERSELGRLLDRRASAMSDVLGVKVSSITGND